MSQLPARTRDGCFNCRSKRRRCDRQRPVCRACRNVRAECVFPAPSSAAAPTRFVVTEASRHYFLPTARNAGELGYLHATLSNVNAAPAKVQPDNGPLNVDNGASKRGKRTAFQSDPISQPRWSLHLGGSRELSLIQYYDEALSNSWVFDQRGQNMFRQAVLPRALGQSGALFYVVLALSAAEWDRLYMSTATGFDHLSRSYKLQAMKRLQNTCHSGAHAESNLLSCVLLSSLEIITADEAWLTHRAGAFALVESFLTSIDSGVVNFATEYFRSRSVLALTATNQSNEHLLRRKAYSNSPCFGRLQADKLRTQEFDVYVGCASDIIDTLDDIKELVQDTKITTRSDSARASQFRCLEERIHQSLLPKTQAVSPSLLKSNKAFGLSALLYLHLTCFNSSIHDMLIIGVQTTLINTLCEILADARGQRQMFPMWPLFIAGCTCSAEEQRATVRDIFSHLAAHWPFHNVTAIERAIWAIWRDRDSLQLPCKSTSRDWQETLSKFGWKLSLT